MTSQRPAQVKNTQELSDLTIAKRYFDLQRLRDEVRKAEISSAVRALHLKPQEEKGADRRVAMPPEDF